MRIATKSIFEIPLERPAFAPGILHGRGWYLGKPHAWSSMPHAQLAVSAEVFPEPRSLLIRLRVFNASADRPRHLCIESHGHTAVNVIIDTANPITLLVQTPLHSPNAEWSPIGFKLDHLDSPFLCGISADERLLGILIEEIVLDVAQPQLPLEFNRSVAIASILAEGWAAPEDNGVWSLGPHATLVLPCYLFTDHSVELIIDGTILPRTPDQEPLEIDICESGAALSTVQFLPGDTGPWRCRLPAGRANFDRRIAFMIRNARSPASLGINADDRPLGLFLRRLSIAD